MRFVIVLVIAACSSKPTPTVIPAEPEYGGLVTAPISTEPGPLAKSHEKLDEVGQCNACHVNDTRELSAEKCVACHDHVKLRARIATNRGLHASAVVKGKPCWACHRDHKGRSYDLTGWQTMKGGMTNFDHALAGWPLRGKHGASTCDQCHKARNAQGLRTFIGTPTACIACHANDTPHQIDPSRPPDCERCHTDLAWTPPKQPLGFDHNDERDARFATGSSHANVECVKCHPKSVFGSTLSDPGACERCHAARSPHGARFDAFGKPPPCAICHTASWRASGFDHGKFTKFQLSHHDTARCRDCHRGAKPADFERLDGKPATCGGCHRHASNVVHDGKYTDAQCQQCHNSSRPPPRTSSILFQIHGPKSPFPLVKGHKSVPCADCHKSGTSGKLTFGAQSPQCSGCHQDSHLGRRGTKCVDCHVSGTWKVAPKSTP